MAIDDVTDRSVAGEVVSHELADVAALHGFVGCLVTSIPDPEHAAGASIVIWTTASGPTSAGHRYAMGNMRRALTLVLQLRAQVRALERAARIDGLTGAASRSHFLELLDELRSSPAGSRHAILYIDLDGFKGVNDHFGHAAGDRVLQETASRIRAAAPVGATIGRLGGDEFVVLCAVGTDEAQACEAAQQIIDAVGQPVAIADGHTTVGASIGIAVGRPGDAPTTVLDAADSALLSAKASGRGRWTIATSRP